MNFHEKIPNFRSSLFSKFRCEIQVFVMRFHEFLCKNIKFSKFVLFQVQMWDSSIFHAVSWIFMKNIKFSKFVLFQVQMWDFMARYSRHSIDDRTNWLWWLGNFFRYCAEDRLDWIPRLIRLNRWLIRSNSMIDLIKFDDRRWLIRSNLVIDPTDCEDSIDWIHDQFLGIRPNTLYRLSHARSIYFKPEMNIIECF
jgi:hypothetical protein